MAHSAKDAWSEVGERLASWKRHLSDHYEEAGSGETSKESQRTLEEAARQIGNRLDRAFSAVDGTLHDEEAKRDLKGAAGAIASAVTATIDDAGSVIRRRGGSDDTWPHPDRPDHEPPPAT